MAGAAYHVSIVLAVVDTIVHVLTKFLLNVRTRPR